MLMMHGHTNPKHNLTSGSESTPPVTRIRMFQGSEIVPHPPLFFVSRNVQEDWTFLPLKTGTLRCNETRGSRSPGEAASHPRI